MPLARSEEISAWLIEYNTKIERFKLTLWVKRGGKSKDQDVKNFGHLDPQSQDIILDMLRYHKPVFWVPIDGADPDMGIIRVETAEVGKFMSIK